MKTIFKSNGFLFLIYKKLTIFCGVITFLSSSGRKYANLETSFIQMIIKAKGAVILTEVEGGENLLFFLCYLFCCKVNSLYFIFKLILISFIIGSLLYDGISEEMGERKEEGRGKNRKRSIKYIFPLLKNQICTYFSWVWRAYAALNVDRKISQPDE